VTITSLHNPRVKEAAKLRQRRDRDKQGRFLIDGARELARAISAGVQLVEVFVCDSLCQTPEARRTLELVDKSGAVVLSVSPAVFARLAFGERAEGVLGVAATPRASLEGLRLPANPLLAVVEDVEKPGNLGAILRTADAAGVSAVIAAGHGTDLYNPNVIRASLGTVFTLPACTASSEATLDFLRQRGVSMCAARLDGALAYTEASFDRPTAIILGSETAGLSAVWRGDDIVGVKLPMLGAADSLNVSAAAAVLFYEALRQRSTSAVR
jgi:TrmH family RNA methyltransferase